MSREIGVEEARKHLGDFVDDAAVDGTVTYLTRRGRRYAAIVPLSRIKEPAMHTVTLVSAVVGDRVDGIEVSDPECPINLPDYPDAVDWATRQGWAGDDNELVYVLAEDAEVPAGFPVYRLEVEATGPRCTHEGRHDYQNGRCALAPGR